MPQDVTRVGSISFPGIEQPRLLSYTCSHGVTAGLITIQCRPQTDPIAKVADLTFGDGVNFLTLRDCVVEQIRVSIDGAGQNWEVVLRDRRWRWEYGSISGVYNKLDPHSKLTPWTIRSPTEICQLCLEAMGETNYVIDMPDGLDQAFGESYSEFIEVGQNFPPTGTNPQVSWENELPAVALSNFADQFGRRVVYDPVLDRVLVIKCGVGDELPDGSIHTSGPSFKSPNVPAKIVVRGAPVKFQVRLQLQAMGVEWDESHRPINALSYTPTYTTAKKQLNTITFPGNVNGGAYTLKIEGQTYSFTGGATAATTAANGVAAAAADRNAVVAVSGSSITVTGRKDGVALYVSVSGKGSYNLLSQVAMTPGPSWQYSIPPAFGFVTVTDRLTRMQALDLARRSVFRHYRVMNVVTTDPAKPQKPIEIPWYGELNRRQQIVLTDTKVEQVVPTPADGRVFNRTDDTTPVVTDFYNGYSRDLPAAVYGSINQNIPRFFYGTIIQPLQNNQQPGNTPPASRIFVDFSIDNEFQEIVFNQPVFATRGGATVEPNLFLETGVFIRDNDTNALVCFEQELDTGIGSGPTLYMKREDVELFVIGEYDANNNLTGWHLLEDDAIRRADYYLQGQLLQYIPEIGQSILYNGIEPVALDGAIQQVTYNVVGGGHTNTQATRQNEHSIFIAPYPLRRRREALAPQKIGAVAVPPPLYNPVE